MGMDDNGLGGLEQKFEPQLHGVPGRMYTAMDARRHVLGSSEREPEPGQNLVLTIDENIQFMAEQALDHAMERTQAANGTVVVQDVHTGQILALAIRPTFNPNHFRHTTPELLRNHAVSDVYEPGSVFKLVTYSAALEQHVATPDDMIDCQGGQITLAGRVIHDDKGDHFGVITVHEALEHSSDVAAVKLALKVGPDRFYQYIRDFGFGSRTGAELPGETRGLLRPVNKWGSSSIGSIAIGQEVGVTPLQLVSMVSTIANGGVYLPPHVLMPGQVDRHAQRQKPAAPQAPSPFKPGGELPNPLPAGAHRVHLHADRRPDAQDDGGRGAVRHRQAGAAQRLLLRRQNRHGAKDRSGHAPLFEDHAHRFLCRYCAGQQSGHRRGRGYRLAQGRSITAPRFPRRSLPRWRSRFWNIWACRTTSMLRRPHALSKADLRMAEDDAMSRPATSTPSMLQSTICPATTHWRASATSRTAASPLATSSKPQVQPAQRRKRKASPATAQQHAADDLIPSPSPTARHCVFPR